MATRMQQRRGTAAQWLSTNNGNGPVLNVGEIGYETDTNKFKIGDGTNHWIALNYFADSVALGGSIDDYVPLTQKGANNGVATLDSSGKIPSSQIPALVGLDTEITSAVNTAVTNLVGVAPSALDTLAELAGALNNDEDFSSTVATELSLKASITYVDNQIDTLESTLTSDLTDELNLKAATTYVDNEISSLSSTLTSDISTAVTTHNNDTTLVHGIDDTAELATKTFAANLLVNATKTNIEITGDKNGLTIIAENGVADSTTDNLSEGTTNKYFTDERAQDAVGNSIGAGLLYDDATGAISVDETFVDSNISAALVAPTISTSLTLDGSGDFTIAADANIVLDATTEVYVGSASSGNEVAIKSYVDAAVGNVDLSTKQDVVSGVSNTEIGYLDGVTSAIQTQLDAKQAIVSGVSNTEIGYLDGVTSSIQTQLDDKAPIASPTFTGTATTDDLVVNGDFTVNGTNFAASATSITIEDNMVQLAHQNAANTVDLGLVVSYNDGSAKHAGIVRDVSDAKWKLFKGVTTEPSTVVAFGEGSLDDLAVAVLEATSISATSATIGDVSNTELQYLNGVTSAIQTQLDAKQAIVSGVSNTEIGYLDGVTSAIQTQIDSKAPTANPTFTGTVSGVTKAHVGLGNVDNTSDANKPVSTATQTALDAKSDKTIAINPQTSNYTLTLSDVDDLVEMNVGSANTLTVPANADVALPVGTRVHIVQTGSGQTTITPGSGVTVNGTPGLKTRAQWSAVTLVKRATNTWVAFGDLTA